MATPQALWFDWDAPAPLTAAHQSELDASAIHRDLQALNFYSLHDREPYDHLLYAADLSRRGDGRLTDYWLRLYDHLDWGGWWCSGLDPLADWQPMLWGCFKPDRPRHDQTERAKPIKYEHPPRVPTRVFCLRVPLTVWRLVAVRYGLPLSGRIDASDPAQFWRWVSANQLPIILCEGAKKAAALLSHGYVAVGLPGIFNGVRSVRDASGQVQQRFLIPDLQCFADQGLSFAICFDYETRPQVIANLRCSVRLLARSLLQQHCPVRVIHLPGPEKGVDDLFVSRSPHVFAACYQQAERLIIQQSHNGLTLVAGVPTAQVVLPAGSPRPVRALSGCSPATVHRALAALGLGSDSVADHQSSVRARLLDALLSSRTAAGSAATTPQSPH